MGRTEPMVPGRTYHMSIDLGYLSRLLDLLEAEGKPQDVLGGDGDFLSYEEARKQIESMVELGMECMPIGDCDNRDELGNCRGHEPEDD